MKATFCDLLNFMERQAKTIQDPLSGELHQPFSSKRVTHTKSMLEKLAFKLKSKGSSTSVPYCTVIIYQHL